MFGEDYDYLMKSARLASFTFLSTVLTVASTASSIYSSVESSEQKKEAKHTEHKIERSQALAAQRSERERKENVRRKMLRGRRAGIKTSGRGVMGKPVTEQRELKTALGA